MARDIEFRFTQLEAKALISILDDAQAFLLSARLRASLGRQVEISEAKAAAIEAERLRRIERAQFAILTKRQAECLAAVRAGQSVYTRPFAYHGNEGEIKWGWIRSRNMGGAVQRMIETMQEEGLLDDRRNLTEGGRARLEAWEAEHGRVGP
jgi:hypothetical protein